MVVKSLEEQFSVCPLLTDKFNQALVNIPARCTCTGFYQIFSTNIRAPDGAFGQRIFCPGLIRRCFFRLKPEMPRCSAPAIFVAQP
jgi:hypothetical protein